MVRYAKQAENAGLDSAELDPAELRERLEAVLRDAMPWLVTISEAEASVPEREGKWSARQVVGHLIDSAVNNLGRIVRLQIEAGQSLPGYQQMEWVKLQDYAEREWAIGHVERASLANRGVVAGEALTLGFLIEDYVAHMEHHLRAMRVWLGSGG
jgi:hypothetical protein